MNNNGFDWIFYKGKGYQSMPNDIRKREYVLVVGYRGVGKSVYAREMSKYNDYVYIEFQSLNTIGIHFRKNAEKIIVISEVKK